LSAEHGELLLLGGVEVELAADPLDHLAAELGGLLGRRIGAVAVAMAAGREAADEEGDAKQAEQGAFDPGFHDRVSFFKEVVEQGLMVPGMARGVLSARYRFVSVYFSAGNPVPQ
jgi:hypothetical protein